MKKKKEIFKWREEEKGRKGKERKDERRRTKKKRWNRANLKGREI